MKNLVILLLLPFLALSQNLPTEKAGKGVTPITNSPSNSTGQTYAVVIGISDYQDKDIPDLRFADKDALAFANFLRSPTGGSLDNEHLKVLMNQEATAGRVAEALDALLEKTKEDDQILIYFSGHGDVERKTVSQPGFLLCWDAPSRVYMGGGTYSLAYLQEVVTTLSTQNKAKVIVVTDACHAGKLAGSQIGGAQLTAANLAKQYTNEIKILSCQPGELSLEGEQWGGGRGIFSYHMVEGLFGLADKNADGYVTLGELDRYLEDHVTAEAAPQSQVPILLGNKTDRLAKVDAASLNEMKQKKTTGLQVFAAIDGRGLEEDVLNKSDTIIKNIYLAFKKVIAERRFFSPENNCAEKYYSILSQNEMIAPLMGMIKRNYAAALQDDAQQTLNKWLKPKQEVSLEATATQRLTQKVFTEKVRTYPRCLDRAAELLGSKHYMYAALKARQYFFEGYLLANSNQNPDAELGGRALALFRQSLAWQPEQPQVYWQMSRVFGWNLLEPDSLEYYTRRAMDIYPNWPTPCLNATFLLSYLFKQQDRARPFLEQASLIDSNSAEVFYYWGVFNYVEKNFAEAERQYKKAIGLDSTNNGFWSNLGLLYLQTRRYAEAEPVLKKAIALDSTRSLIWNTLGRLYRSTGRYAEAEQQYKKAIALDSTNASAWSNLGFLYNDARRYAEAEPVLKKAFALDSTNATYCSNLGFCYFQTRRYAEAEPVYKKAIALDSTVATAWNSLGLLYNNTRRFAEAEPVLKKAIALDSTLANPHKHLGMVYFKTNRPDLARQNFLKAIALNPNYLPARLGMAYILQSEGKTVEAIGYVEQAIAKGSTLEQLEKDDDLTPLRATPDWKALMKKHFPNQFKD